MILIITREKMVLILLQIQAVLIPLFSSQVIILKLPGKPPTVMGIIWFMFLKMVKVALQLSITSLIRIKALNYFIMRAPMVVPIPLKSGIVILLLVMDLTMKLY